MSKLTGLGTRPVRIPVQARCFCGCGAYADHGFPGGLWFTRAHIPAELRGPRAAPASAPAPAVRAVEPPAAPAMRDLFSPAPAGSGRPPT